MQAVSPSPAQSKKPDKPPTPLDPCPPPPPAAQAPATLSPPLSPLPTSRSFSPPPRARVSAGVPLPPPSTSISRPAPSVASPSSSAASQAPPKPDLAAEDAADDLPDCYLLTSAAAISRSCAVGDGHPQVRPPSAASPCHPGLPVPPSTAGAVTGPTPTGSGTGMPPRAPSGSAPPSSSGAATVADTEATPAGSGAEAAPRVPSTPSPPQTELASPPPPDVALGAHVDAHGTRGLALRPKPSQPPTPAPATMATAASSSSTVAPELAAAADLHVDLMPSCSAPPLGGLGVVGSSFTLSPEDGELVLIEDVLDDEDASAPSSPRQTTSVSGLDTFHVHPSAPSPSSSLSPLASPFHT
ncbi:extensin-like [Miscanthus floridulus]|uniref:extensin-like n=1 Tax=Miscanthus floridulus TaxID=154761 RepID=UPI0034592B47